MAELKFLRQIFRSSDVFLRLDDAISKNRFPIAVEGLSLIHTALLSASLSDSTDKKVLIITAEEAEAARLVADVNATGRKALLLPARDLHYASSSGASKEYEQKRIDTLARMAAGDFDVVAASAEAVLQKVIPKSAILKTCFSVKSGNEYDIEKLTEQLILSGYTRCELVDTMGTFARRGGIIDLFPVSSPNPLRIEFWGDEIDTISYFDAETQRRTDTVEEISLTPASEFAVNNTDLSESLEQYLTSNDLTDKQQKTLRSDIALINAGISVEYDRYLNAVLGDNTVFDYLDDAIVIVNEETAVRSKLLGLEEFSIENIKLMLEQGCYFDSLSAPAPSVADFELLTKNKNIIYCENFSVNHSLPVTDTLHFALLRSNVWSSGVEVLKDDIYPLLKNSGLVIILTANERAAGSLCLSLADVGLPAQFIQEVKGLPKSGIVVTCGALSSGFTLLDRNVAVVSACAEKATHQRKRKFRQNENAKQLTSLEELKKGDYVVHASHGIGVFDGINTITTSGVTKDYIKINYAGTDVLYVPVTQLDLVSKYIGSKEDVTIKLNRLSGNEWNNTRKRVRAAVKDMAKQLTELYSKRMTAKGFAFSPDTDMQSDFERRFAYDETEDQLRCINEIKNDMERSVPMDRLLCGDVGFGKTEVALRAAFKCVSEGKQCALLVPTTILAWQHFKTVKERFSHFPVEVEMLSRFVSPTKQKKIVSGIRTGRVDMVIGTHRLISNDVAFNDLGLVIIDEEQRFGVAQKEKLKERYTGVDVLTLSATPIPRTLNMAMSGLRDMSSIDEAPGDRYPVQTYVMEQNNAVLHEAIHKELRRGGQVYYLHNRVESIELTAAKLKAAFPDANIGVAHGKMSEDALSDVWRSLIEQEIDILVCTTIIETGVDVPNANTLIIEDADRMGLAQLHQLRGRVGRSSRRAYAYFCYKLGKSVSEIATQRLEAMREFTEFGSGFRIAMRDLEIRGAGSVLGGEQHGHLESVGYDMYIKMLSEAIKEQKGEITVSESECLIDVDITAHIPEKYIPALSQRLSMYRRIAAIRTSEDVSDVTDELCDRFGEPPKPVMGLIKVAYLRNTAAACNITEITQRNGMILVFINKIEADSVSKMTAAFGRRFYLSVGDKPYYSIKPEKNEKTIDILEKIANVLSS